MFGRESSSWTTQQGCGKAARQPSRVVAGDPAALGDEALFRIGGDTRKGPTRSVKLSSGDVLVFGGVARDAFHGIDRIMPGTSTLVPGGGRLNLTLRRVKPANLPKENARPGG